MTLSTGDLFAVMIALSGANLVLIIAMRRVYVLERRLRYAKQELRLLNDPTIWDN